MKCHLKLYTFVLFYVRVCTPVCAHGCMSNNKLNKTIFFYVLFVSYDESIVSKSLILDEDDQLIKSFDNYYYCVYFWRLIIGCVPAREWRTRLEEGNTIFSSFQVRQWYTLPTVNVNKIIVKKWEWVIKKLKRYHDASNSDLERQRLIWRVFEDLRPVISGPDNTKQMNS